MTKQFLPWQSYLSKVMTSEPQNSLNKSMEASYKRKQKKPALTMYQCKIEENKQNVLSTNFELQKSWSRKKIEFTVNDQISSKKNILLQEEPKMLKSSKSYKTIKFTEQEETNFKTKQSKNLEEKSKKTYKQLKDLMKSIQQNHDKTQVYQNKANFFNKSYINKGYEEKKNQMTKSLKTTKSYKEIPLPNLEKYDYQFSKQKIQEISKEKYEIQFDKKMDLYKERKEEKYQHIIKSNKYQTPSFTETAFLTKKSYKKLPLNEGNENKGNKISIEDFKLGPCKGQGAFGQVFVAIHQKTNMIVAIKKIPKEKVKYMLDQFISEIKIQMFLDHPNIVKLYGFFDDFQHVYIIMEYIEDGCLYNYIKRHKKLNEIEASEKIRQICLGLEEMHTNEILHRDIKPENIVMTNNVCKICDFGWSAVCKDRRTTYCGTLDYVSPEILEGDGYDDSVDIWCIGVLAYEIICGKTPFYNISRKETMKKIMGVHYDYPNEISKEARQFIDKILKKNPNERVGIEEILKENFLTQNIKKI